MIKKIKSKLEDWYYYLLNLSVRRFWDNIKRWFSYYNTLRKVYDFDYSSILEVERYQMIRVRDNIAKYQHHTEWSRDVKYINLAIKLLDIIEENGCSDLIGGGFTFNGDTILRDPNAKWTIPVYVNTKNSHRFWNIGKDRFEDPKTGALMKDTLRIEKAWNLYHKVRLHHLREWWS